MDARLQSALERHPLVDDWTVRRQVGRGAQVYLTAGTVESVRSVGREAYEVELFRDLAVAGEPRRGAATVPVQAGDLDRLEPILDEATAMAALVHNPPWSLPERAEPSDVLLVDPELRAADPVALARDTADRIAELARAAGPGVWLSSAELFLTVVDEELRNSRGVETGATSSRVLFELTLLVDGPREAEFFHQTQTRRLADLHLPELVAESARFARDAARAGSTPARQGPVVIRDAALEQLLGSSVVGSLGAYLLQTSAAAAYDHLSRFQVGESIYLGHDPTGDLLSFRSSARYPFGVLSYAFDPDGLPAMDLPVVEEGVLRRLTATQRYGQYLGVPPTGRPGVLDIAAGNTPLAQLLDGGPVLEVAAFSAANVDVVSGDFGMEVRLGYEIGPGGRRPVRGGSVTGNLFEAMAAARFSAETGDFPGFSGPRAIRFESLQVAGEES